MNPNKKEKWKLQAYTRNVYSETEHIKISTDTGESVGKVYNTHAPEGKANAKLIAAAPLLLSEHEMDLQHLRTWKTHLIDAGLRGSILFEEYKDMIEAKKKAIQNATP